MAIVDHEVKSDGLPQIVVKDTVDALGELARYNIVRRRELDGDFDIIGLTGSVGKTTTRICSPPACHRRSDRGSGGIVQQ